MSLLDVSMTISKLAKGGNFDPGRMAEWTIVNSLILSGILNDVLFVFYQMIVLGIREVIRIYVLH